MNKQRGGEKSFHNKRCRRCRRRRFGGGSGGVDNLATTTVVSLVVVATTTLLITTTTCAAAASSAYQPFGYQYTPPSPLNNDDTYGGGMYYDNTNQLLYITGGTYGNAMMSNAAPATGGEEEEDDSDCFISVIKLPTEHQQKEQQKEPEVLYKKQYGQSTTPEVCTSTVALPSSNKLYVIGHTEENGLFTTMRNPGSDVSKVYGFVMDVDTIEATTSVGEEEEVVGMELVVEGGKLLHDHTIQYPVSITNDGNGEIYVAMMVDDVGDSNPAYDNAIFEAKQRYGQSKVHMDLTAGGGTSIPKYGTNFSIRINKLGTKLTKEMTPGTGETMNVLWTELIGTSNQRSVRISSILYVPGDTTDKDVLLFAGTTAGYGAPFGATEMDDGVDGNDLDGFIAKMDPTTGMVPSKTNVNDMTETQKIAFGSKYARRIKSTQPTTAATAAAGKDDVITSLCIQPNTKGVDVVYVVGSTHGTIEEGNDSRQTNDQAFHAFISKLDINSLDVIWTKQLGARPSPKSTQHNGSTTDALGQGCAVSPDGRHIFLAGTVLDGAVLDVDEMNSYGGNDIFVMEIQTLDGQINFVRQLGTDKDDGLARGGGVEVDDDGNGIVMGTTRGSLMRWKDDTAADVFVMSLERRTGRHLPMATETMETSSNNKDTTTSTQSDDDDGKISAFGLTAIMWTIIGLVVVAILLLVQFIRRARTRKQYDSSDGTTRGIRDKNVHVSEFLKDFDDVQVDLRHSATGGWHGMYDIDFPGDALPAPSGGGGTRRMLGDELDLDEADGTVWVATPPEEVVTVVDHAAGGGVIRESLFSDEDETPNLGGVVGVEDTGIVVDRRISGGGGGKGGGGSRKRDGTKYDGLAQDSLSVSSTGPRPPPPAAFSMPGSGGGSRKKTDTEYDLVDEKWGLEII